MTDEVSNKNDFVRKRALLAWLVWGLAAAYFFSDYLARVSIGVMGRELQISFEVSAGALGLLSSFFYYPYIVMQMPVGLMVDRYSIRLLLTSMSFVTALGCVVFGSATNLWWAGLGRGLIGFSAAFAFVSALRLAASWFPAERLGLLAGLTQALGMWGAAFGEAPVALIMSYLSWRNTMYLIAVLFCLLAVLILFFVQDRPSSSFKNLKKQSKPSTSSQPLSVLKSLKMVLLNSQTWLVALYAGFLFAPSAVIAELWGPSYLEYGRGLSKHAAAFATGLIFIGWGIGGPIAGWLSDKLGKRKPVMYGSAVCGALILSLIFYCQSLTAYQLYALFFLYGFTNIGVVVAYAVATEINPKPTVGASIAFANMGSIFIGAICQPIFGKVIEYGIGHKVVDISTLTATDFSIAVSLLPICSVIALVIAFILRETNCMPLEVDD